MLGVLGGGGATIAAYGALQIEPAFADWADSEGPNFVEVVNVKKFGAVGQGDTDGTDDIDAIERAIAAAKSDPYHQRPVYFPAGIYLISRPLEVAGCHLIGDLPHGDADGAPFPSTIRAHPTFAGDPLGDGVPLVRASSYASPLFIDGLTLDANGLADFGLVALSLRGGSVLRSLRLLKARLDGLLAENVEVSRISDITTSGSGRHGFNIVSCNGLILENFTVHDYGSAGDTNACGIFVRASTTTTPKGSLNGGKYSTKADAGAARIQYGTIQAGGPHSGPSLHFQGIYTTPTHLDPAAQMYVTSVSIRTNGHCDGIFLDKCTFMVIANCQIIADNAPDHQSVAIRLFNSSHNVLRSNFLDMSGTSDNKSPKKRPFGDRIALGFGCYGNHVHDNLLARPGADAGVSITYPNGDEMPTMNTHALGQRKVITYATSKPPNSGRWQRGDIVFNSAPRPGQPTGWVCVRAHPNVRFRRFGKIST